MDDRLLDELNRSAADAHREAAEDLRCDPVQLARYRVQASTPAIPNPAYPLEYAFQLMGDVRSKLVVDFGCGSGLDSVTLAIFGAQVIGIDLSPDLLQVARRRAAVNGVSLRLISCSADHIPLDSHSVDIVFGAAILHHLPDLEAAGAEVQRILKPGGFAVFSEPVRESRLAHWYRRLRPRTGDNISPGEYPLRERDIQRFCGSMPVVACKAFGLPHLKLIDSKFTRRVERMALDLTPWLQGFTRNRVFKCVMAEPS